MNHNKHRSEESVEDYLETILVLSKRISNVRSIDIANELSYSKPSVSVAMKHLRENQYISISEEGFITLTSDGRDIAEAVYERHSLITEWLIHIGVEPSIAKTDACKMEHDISPESFDAIKKHILSVLNR